ncbi:MAG: site-specific integrase [Candidatus Paceibacterota bacterium]|jgi:integrase/recombinase XerD
METKPLLRDYFEEYLTFRAQEGSVSKTLLEHKRFLYGPLDASVGYKKVEDLRLIDRAALIEAGKPHGIFGSQRAVVTFRQLCRFLNQRGMRLPFDWQEIKTPHVPSKMVDYLTSEEIEKIRHAFDTNSMAGLRTRCLIELLLDTGMRIGEACSVNREDVNFERHEIRIKNCKTHEDNVVYFTDRSAEWVKLYLAARHDNNPALFITGRDRMLPLTSRNYIRAKTKELGIKKKIGHHVFRKTCGTYMLQHQIDIKSVQNLLRHKSERTTLRYYIGVDKERCKVMHQAVMAQI